MVRVVFPAGLLVDARTVAIGIIGHVRRRNADYLVPNEGKPRLELHVCSGVHVSTMHAVAIVKRDKAS